MQWCTHTSTRAPSDPSLPLSYGDPWCLLAPCSRPTARLPTNPTEARALQGWACAPA